MSQTAPQQSLSSMRALIPKRLQPLLRGIRKRWQRRSLELPEPFATVFPFTQASLPRQENLVELARTLEREKIGGAIVECGVLDGGTAALMAHSTAGSSRPIHLFDAWEGLPERTEEDGADADKWVGQVVGSPRRVATIMNELGVRPDRIHIHHGWFHETFPRAEIADVGLLHVDCDFYEPTKLCLERWWPRILRGGFVQFDDYLAFAGCKQAVDEFLVEHTDVDLIVQDCPGGAVYLRKPA